MVPQKRCQTYHADECLDRVPTYHFTTGYQVKACECDAYAEQKPTKLYPRFSLSQKPFLIGVNITWEIKNKQLTFEPKEKELPSKDHLKELSHGFRTMTADDSLIEIIEPSLVRDYMMKPIIFNYTVMTGSI